MFDSHRQTRYDADKDWLAAWVGEAGRFLHDVVDEVNRAADVGDWSFDAGEYADALDRAADTAIDVAGRAADSDRIEAEDRLVPFLAEYAPDLDTAALGAAVRRFVAEYANEVADALTDLAGVVRGARDPADVDVEALDSLCDRAAEFFLALTVPGRRLTPTPSTVGKAVGPWRCTMDEILNGLEGRIPQPRDRYSEFALKAMRGVLAVARRRPRQTPAAVAKSRPAGCPAVVYKVAPGPVAVIARSLRD